MTNMKSSFAKLLPLVSLAAAVLSAQEVAPLKVAQTIPLPGVTGKFDHYTLDAKRNRLYLSASGNGTVEAIDLAAGKPFKSIPGFQKAQGIKYVADVDKLYVTDGKAGNLKIFNGDTLEPIATLELSADADYINYDPVHKRIYAAHGGDDAGHDYGELAIVDANTNQVLGNIRTAGHPEAFVFENTGDRMFANIPDNSTVAVVDTNKKAVTQSYPVTGAQKNVPMAFDEPNHRLFLATRNPGKFFVLDSNAGKTITVLDTVSGADDMAFDPQHKLIYVSGGEGFFNVYRQDSPDQYSVASRTATAPNAKTSLLAPEIGRFFVVIPQQGSKAAELRIYQALN
jgi:DNA-binding beta-propeller fold protein YncE